MFGKPFSLFVLVAACSSVVAVTIIALVARSVEIVNSEQMTVQIAQSNAILAAQVQHTLDRDLAERVRSIEAAARILGLRDVAVAASSSDGYLRQSVADSGYIWMAQLDVQGNVLQQAGASEAGRDVAQWACAKSAPARGVCEHNGSASEGLVDLFVPVRDAQGHAAGAIAAVLGKRWLGDLVDSLMIEKQGGQGNQVIVASNAGSVLFSSLDGLPKSFKVPDLREITGGDNYTIVDHWPGYAADHKFIVGRTPIDAQTALPALPWTILISRDTDIALASLTGEHRQILIISFILALHAVALAWYMARAVSAPLAGLARAAQDLHQGRAGSAIPLISTFAEVDVLSKSLISLVGSLKAREAEQTGLAGSLERLVIERTGELAQRNQSLEAANRLAADATKAKTRFLAAASHDLRQPLHALALFTRALERRVSGAEAPRLVGQMGQSIHQLTRMFDALLHISRLDAGAITADMTTVPLGQLMSGLSGGFAAEAEQRGLRFICRPAEHDILTDATLLETILRNVMANAMKFTSSGGVLLAARRRGARVAIEVYDTGVGIPDDRYDSIFQEFERATADASGPNDGLGLGLSIVKRYAGLIGAEIEVRSRIGKGSRFSVLIPYVCKISVPAVREGRLQPGFKFLNQHVLLLDDNCIGLEALASNLRDQGAIVSAFATPEAAGAALGRGRPVDVIVVDYDLGGGKTGLDFLLSHVNTRSLIITGRTDQATLAILDESRFPWLLKPADPDAIAAVLSRDTRL